MKTRFGKAIVSGLALVFIICVAASANAKSYYAGTPATCGVALGPAVVVNQSIQTVVTAAETAGATIVKVCPGGGTGLGGSYQEQVTIHKKLTLEGITVSGANQAVITAPSSLTAISTLTPGSPNQIAAQILVEDTAGPVNISDLVVDGTGNTITICSPELIGIYYRNASGIVNHVVTRHQDGVFSGCESGYGIFVQSGADLAFPAGGTSVVTIENSSVHDFDFAGITGNDFGTALTVTNNQVRGTALPLPGAGCPAAPVTYYPTNSPAPLCGSPQIGIQIGFKATGAIKNNTVINEIWPDASTDSGTGMQAYDASGITMSTNHVGNTQYGIAAVADGNGTADTETILTNVVDGTQVIDAIDICGSNGTTVKTNTVRNSGQSAIHLDGTCVAIGGPAGGTTIVSGNILNEACAGILNGTLANTFPPPVNTFYNVVNTIPIADSATCTPPTGGDAMRALTAGSGQHGLHAARP